MESELIFMDDDDELEHQKHLSDPIRPFFRLKNQFKLEHATSFKNAFKSRFYCECSRIEETEQDVALS